MEYRKIILGFVFWICVVFVNAQILHPSQPTSGPGGSDYVHEGYQSYDFAKKADGYWLYEPSSPAPDSANVVVFLHGYGVLNPVVYGGWVKHLVRKGNIVICPRYQKSLFTTAPSRYAKNTTNAIHDAIEELQQPGHVKPRMENWVYAGHSYGGAIAGYLAVLHEEFKVPKPKGILLAQPGTGGFKGSKLDSYKDLDEDIKMIITVGEGDHVVGDKLARLVLSTARAKHQNLLLHFKDIHGAPIFHSSHAQPVALEPEMDNNKMNYIIRAAMKRADTDGTDFYCYWKVLDALIDCSFYDKNCHYAFGNTKEQKYMGKWSDGKPVQPMIVFEHLDN